MTNIITRPTPTSFKDLEKKMMNIGEERHLKMVAEEDCKVMEELDISHAEIVIHYDPTLPDEYYEELNRFKYGVYYFRIRIIALIGAALIFFLTPFAGENLDTWVNQFNTIKVVFLLGLWNLYRSSTVMHYPAREYMEYRTLENLLGTPVYIGPIYDYEYKITNHRRHVSMVIALNKQRLHVVTILITGYIILTAIIFPVAYFAVSNILKLF